jgi:hypothetical protein
MTEQQASCEDFNEAFEAIDAMTERVNRFKVDPQLPR